MKKHFFRFPTQLILSVLLIIGASATAFAYPTGAPAGYTGSPGDGFNCTSCHGGSATAVTGWITSNIPTQGYTAGTLYTITVTASGSGKKGFEVSPQNATGTQLGTLTAGTGNHTVGGTKYVTHSAAGSTSSTVTWSFSWTAPVAGTGAVTFYGAIVVGKPNIKLCTLVVNEFTASPLTSVATATPQVICAGQTSQLNVVPSGGSGTYTYSWTSVPPGFTSTLSNPVVNPSISTQYTAHVSDGVLTSNAPTSVTVNQPATATAGNDSTCAYITAQVPLQGIASNYISLLWTTSGTGTFSSASALTGNYFPSTADKDGGNITLTLTATPVSPCSTSAIDSRVIHFDFPAGMADPQNALTSVVLSPNPCSGKFSIRVNGIEDHNAMVTVTDICGKSILFQEMELAYANQPGQIDMTGYPRGLYLVKVEAGTRSYVRKLFVE